MPKKLTLNNFQFLLLSFLIISGGIKPFLLYYNFNIDITLFILILISLDIIIVFLFAEKIIIKKYQVLYVLMIIIFFLASILSILYTPSSEYVYEKIAFMLIPLIGFVYPLFIKEFNLKILYQVLLYVVLPICIWFILFRFLAYTKNDSFYPLINKSAFKAIRLEYLNLGYLLGVLIVLATKYAKTPFFVIIVCALLMLGLGARGALIFSLLCLFIIYFKSFIAYLNKVKFHKRLLKNILLFSIPILTIFLIFSKKLISYLNFGLSRFSSLLDFSSDTSSIERLNQYSFVLEKAVTFQGLTIGYGLGSFGSMYLGLDEKAYPHNIFLEVWFELGFLMLILIVFFFISPFFLNKSNLLKILALFALLNAMKTSSFAYDRNLFIIFGILIFSNFYKNKNLV